jgi:hypothetical protein
VTTMLSGRTQGKTVSQVAKLARRLERVKCSWKLTRYERDGRFGYIDVQSWSSADMDLFGMLAMIVVHRDHVRGSGMLELVCYAPRRIVALKVRKERR